MLLKEVKSDINCGIGMSRTYLCISILLLCCSIAHANQASDNARKDAFTYIYHHKDVWEGTESASGIGSTLIATETLRCVLPAIIKALEVQVLLDAGCGDLNWIKRIPFDVACYIGVDIVDELIKVNTEKYNGDWIKFQCLDITKDELPYADLILCRDCLQHLSFEDIKAAINNFKRSGAKYLLATTYVNLHENIHDIQSGCFHLVNLMKKPFNFPEPIFSFDELSAEPEMIRWRKRMCVWNLSEI